MHIQEHMCICISNMKFLCLTLWQEEVCTDDNADAKMDANVNNDDAQFMTVLGSLVDKPNEPKILRILYVLFNFLMTNFVKLTIERVQTAPFTHSTTRSFCVGCYAVQIIFTVWYARVGGIAIDSQTCHIPLKYTN